MAITGQQIGSILTKALDLPKYTVSFELRCKVDEIVTVACEYYPEGSALCIALETVFAEYDLVRREAPKQVEQQLFHFDDWMRARTNAAHAAFKARLGRTA